MADSNSSESRSISGSSYSDFEVSMEGEGAYEPVVKSASRDLNRLDEPKIERETQRRIMGPCAAAASIVHSMKYNTSISTEC